MRHKSKVLLIVIFIIQVGFLCFLLWQYVLQPYIQNQQPIAIQTIEQKKDKKQGSGESFNLVNLSIFARESGSVYFTIKCIDVKKFDGEELIWFISEKEAQSRGLKKSKQCE
ncbi:hypothetical protein H6776_02400 [Candidatus Nomurabacteria bacterium]|nr:hypothetical protein [Candidatus Nomurabacteria bacterium]